MEKALKPNIPNTNKRPKSRNRGSEMRQLYCNHKYFKGYKPTHEIDKGELEKQIECLENNCGGKRIFHHPEYQKLNMTAMRQKEDKTWYKVYIWKCRR